MRLFYALWPDAELQQAMAGWASACRARSRGRVTRTENLHATLAFLGEVAPENVPALCELGQEMPAQAFELSLDRLGYWPHNRIVYAGSSETPAALTLLAGALRARLANEGYRVDARPYLVHVTLLRDAVRPPTVVVEPLLWRVRDIVLVESVREQGALVYRPIQRFTLAA